MSLPRRLATYTLAAVVLVLLALPAAALAHGADDGEGVLVRVGGDASIEPSTHVGTVVVVNGDLRADEAEAGTVVIFNGTAVLAGSEIETLVVVDGSASLLEGTTISGDVILVGSDLVTDGSTTVEGSVVEGFEGSLFVALWIFLIILAIGLGVLAIVTALLFAAIAPNTARAATHVIAKDFGATVLAGLVFWLALPAAAALVLLTVVGIPISFAVWGVLMPAVGFLGFTVTGIWIGDLILARGSGTGRPYLAAFLGTLLLVLVGLIPGLGWLIWLLASLLGGSALALLAWRSFRTDEVGEVEPESADEVP